MENKKTLMEKARLLLLLSFVLVIPVLNFIQNENSLSQYGNEVIVKDILFAVSYILGIFFGVFGLIKMFMNKETKIVGLLAEGTSPALGLFLLIIGMCFLLAIQIFK